jgi:hypothetical protein
MLPRSRTITGHQTAQRLADELCWENPRRLPIILNYTYYGRVIGATETFSCLKTIVSIIIK